MNIKEKIETLKQKIGRCELELKILQSDLSLAESNISNHIYESLEQAENFLFNMFENMAQEDCEGSYNCGCEEYKQDFIVDGKEYTAFGSFEYNRHDKTYWYVDGSSYRYEER